MTDDGLILICAFRYALGRRSYVVAAVAEEVRRRRHALRPSDRSLIMREIEEALKEDRAGMAMDRNEWVSTHATLAGTTVDDEGFPRDTP